MCNDGPRSNRECVKGGPGTRSYRIDFSVLPGDHTAIEHVFLWGGIMSNNSLYRAERCRDLARECRAIAALCEPSTEMRTHYLRMSEHYNSLADAEELDTLAFGR
jgi:hypothetical protein